jgi:hypothetical protein
MTDAERAALLILIQYPAGPGLRVTTPEAADCILRVVEPAIRADERARVVAEATTDEAVGRATKLFVSLDNEWKDDMREAIRAALGDGL